MWAFAENLTAIVKGVFDRLPTRAEDIRNGIDEAKLKMDELEPRLKDPKCRADYQYWSTRLRRLENMAKNR